MNKTEIDYLIKIANNTKIKYAKSNDGDLIIEMLERNEAIHYQLRSTDIEITEDIVVMIDAFQHLIDHIILLEEK